MDMRLLSIMRRSCKKNKKKVDVSDRAHKKNDS